MIPILLAPKPAWLIFFLGYLALTVTVGGGILAGLDIWGVLALVVQLVLGLMVLTLAVVLTWQHREAAKSGLSVIIGALACVHSLALVLGSATSM